MPTFLRNAWSIHHLAPSFADVCFHIGVCFVFAKDIFELNYATLKKTSENWKHAWTFLRNNYWACTLILGLVSIWWNFCARLWTAPKNLRTKKGPSFVSLITWRIFVATRLLPKSSQSKKQWIKWFAWYFPDFLSVSWTWERFMRSRRCSRIFRACAHNGSYRTTCMRLYEIIWVGGKHDPKFKPQKDKTQNTIFQCSKNVTWW